MFTNPSNFAFSTSDIEREISFTREQYEEKRAAATSEHIDFDDFLEKVLEITLQNQGNLNDAVFVADDAFDKL